MQAHRVKKEEAFRFLSDAEFRALDVKHKAMYLLRASQELEQRQRELRGSGWSMKAMSWCEPSAG